MKTIKFIFLIILILILVFVCSSCILKEMPFDQELFESLFSDEFVYVDDSGEYCLILNDSLYEYSSINFFHGFDEYCLSFSEINKYSTNSFFVHYSKINYDNQKSYKGRIKINFYEDYILLKFDKDTITLMKVERTHEHFLGKARYNYISKEYGDYIIDDKFVFSDNSFVYLLNEDGKSYSINAKDTTLKGNVIIPDSFGGLPITCIGGINNNSSGFKGCRDLESISIPNSVEIIGEMAFSDCSSLVSIEIPDNVVELGDAVFAGCYNLQKVTLSKNCLNIPKYAFAGCLKLKECVNSDVINKIGTKGFYYCLSIESISLSNTEIIGLSAFEYCKNLKRIDGLNNLKEIGEKAMIYCFNLEEFVISDYVKRLPNSLFMYDKSLKKLSFGKNIEEVGTNIIYGTEIEQFNTNDLKKLLNNVLFSI